MGESISVERVRHALVLRRAGADDDALALAARLPDERYRTPVVVGASALPALARLDPWLVADLADATEKGLRLIAPNLGAMGEDGTLPPARRLADRLGVEVVAPNGTPVVLPDGGLFVREPGAGWVSYQPDRPRVRSGPRHPSPWWQNRLPVTLPGQATPIPAGLWVRQPGGPERPDDPLHQGVPDHDRMYVVLGAPGEQPPEVTAVAEMLRALPAEARDGIVLASYGVPDLGASIAEELGAPLRVAHGVPLDGRPVHVDETGAFTWRPFALESLYRPGETPLLRRWVAPGPALGMGGRASYKLAEGWRVDVVARGLLVRPEELTPDPEWAAGTGPTADVLLASDVPVPGEVLAAIDGLMRGLPGDARDHLRVVPMTEHAAVAASRLEVAASAVPFASGSLRLEASESAAGETEVRGEPASEGGEVWADEETEPAVVHDEPAVDDAFVVEEEVVEPPSGAVVVTADGCVLPAEPILAVAALPGYSGHSDPVAGLVDEPVPPPLPSVAASIAPPPLPSIATSIPVPPQAAKATAGTGEAGKPTDARRTVRAEMDPAEKDPAEKDQREPAEDTHRKRDTEAAHTSDVMTVAPSGPRAQAAPGNLSIEDIRRPLTTVHLPGERAPEPAETTGNEAREPKAAAPLEPLPVLTPRVTAVSRPPVTATPVRSTSDSCEEPWEPVPSEPPASPVVPPVVEVPADARSTPEQRQAVRGMLGSAYDVATRAVTRMLSERPGLRAIPSEHAALLAELAVVRIFAQKPTENYDTDFQVCLASGLRRLPTARTVVVRGIPAETEVRPRTVLRLSSPVLVAPAVPAVAVGPAEALIWTTTARRLDGLLPENATDLLLPGHTRLRVLAVDEGPLRRILLAEEGTPDEAALSRLQKALAARATAGTAGGPEAAPRWFGPLPGIREIA